MTWPLSAKLTTGALAAIATVSLLFNADHFRVQSQAPVVLQPPEMLALAQQHFPAEYASASNPDSQLLVLVVDRSRSLLGKGVGETEPGVDLAAAIRRVVPTFDPGARGSMASACFPAAPGEHGKFCIALGVSST